MNTNLFEMGDIDIAWCPGCGNYSILDALKLALTELQIVPEKLVIVSGIGQAAKIPHYLRTNVFNGLHGRAVPVATAIRAVNTELTVIAEGGDGDMYGEGGNHFIHAMRRNPNITHIVHNNMVYALTKGQASPTSQWGFKTPVQVAGVMEEPFNAIAIAISQDASFVARALASDVEKTKNILQRAIAHKGYALVDIFQHCLSFNKVNTYQWFKDNTYYLEDDHDPHDRQRAFERATEKGQFPLGIFYMNPAKPCFEETLSAYRVSREPLFKRRPDMESLIALVDGKRGG